MRSVDLVQETWSALSANKGRSALTILGIVIGISAVIAMNAIIGGISVGMSQMFGANASRLITITLQGINNFYIDDAQDIASNVAGYDYILCKSNGKAPLLAGKNRLDGEISGVDAKSFEAHGYKFLQGEPFTENDVKNSAQVVVLDQYGAKLLFGSIDADVIGKTLRVGNDNYRVVGITDKLDDFGMGAYYTKSAYVAMPISTACERVTGTQSITSMEGMATEGADTDEVAAATQTYLANRYKLTAQSGDEEDEEADNGTARTVSARSNKRLMQQINGSMESFRAIMVVVSGISLLVGGIGIMNMMLTNVTERIREIGLRKALGARRIDITSQFILESICLCLAGGFFGVLFGLAAAFALMTVVGTGLGATMGIMDSSPLVPVIEPTSILNAVGVCMITGLVFGWYPAQRAAKLDPVESLNHQ